jgi:hypothetical protein
MFCDKKMWFRHHTLRSDTGTAALAEFAPPLTRFGARSLTLLSPSSRPAVAARRWLGRTPAADPVRAAVGAADWAIGCTAEFGAEAAEEEGEEEEEEEAEEEEEEEEEDEEEGDEEEEEAAEAEAGACEETSRPSTAGTAF